MNLSLLFPQLRKISAISAHGVINQGSANGNFLIIQSTTNSGFKSLSEDNLYFFPLRVTTVFTREKDLEN